MNKDLGLPPKAERPVCLVRQAAERRDGQRQRQHVAHQSHVRRFFNVRIRQSACRLTGEGKGDGRVKREGAPSDCLVMHVTCTTLTERSVPPFIIPGWKAQLSSRRPRQRPSERRAGADAHAPARCQVTQIDHMAAEPTHGPHHPCSSSSWLGARGPLLASGRSSTAEVLLSRGLLQSRLSGGD